MSIDIPRHREAVVSSVDEQVIPWRLKDSTRTEPVHVSGVSPVEKEIENLQAVLEKTHTNLH